MIVLMIFIFLCVLIIPLRGPSKKKTNSAQAVKTPKEFSKYAVNEDGWLEEIDAEGDQKR